ncbi:hypothetical protein NP493_1917g00001 [Ridgeia piscesae]|uniref:VWFD domain-containing protein n=1 Tax=Ridgeia piscesae TaxID=27915 RepID=A0AAD9N7L2_RIDPI|nr:hypothetical protein NP493_1917g00001 [Ridgeia piscesae]
MIYCNVGKNVCYYTLFYCVVGLILYIEEKDVTSWFNAASDNDDAAHDKVSVSRKSATSVDVTFSSGFTLAIGVKAQQLDITVGAPSEFKNLTQGLMGIFNGDSSDDLTPASGRVALNSNGSSERDIFSQFGETWRIERADSIFKYIDDTTFETFDRKDFEPLFLQEVLNKMTDEEKKKVDEKCKGNNECIFDYAITGKEDAADASLDTSAKNTKEAETLANSSPLIAVSSVLNATIDKEVTLHVTTSDKDGDDVTLSLQSELPVGATFDAKSGTFKWTPRSLEPVNIS